MIETVIEAASTISTHTDATPDTRTMASKLVALAGMYRDGPTEKIRKECLRLSTEIYERTRERTGQDLYNKALEILTGQSLEEVFA